MAEDDSKRIKFCRYCDGTIEWGTKVCPHCNETLELVDFDQLDFIAADAAPAKVQGLRERKRIPGARYKDDPPPGSVAQGGEPPVVAPVEDGSADPRSARELAETEEFPSFDDLPKTEEFRSVVEPIEDGPPVLKPISKGPPVVKPISKGPPVVKPISKGPPVLKPVSKGPPVVKPVSKGPPVVKPVSKGPPVVKPVSMSPPVVKPVSKGPPVIAPVGNEGPGTSGSETFRMDCPVCTAEMESPEEVGGTCCDCGQSVCFACLMRANGVKISASLERNRSRWEKHRAGIRPNQVRCPACGKRGFRK